MDKLVKLLSENIIYFEITKERIFVNYENWLKARKLLRENQINYYSISYSNDEFISFKIV